MLRNNRISSSLLPLIAMLVAFTLGCSTRETNAEAADEAAPVQWEVRTFKAEGMDLRDLPDLGPYGGQTCQGRQGRRDFA